MKRKKQKRPSPYRRLETELANARHSTQQAVEVFLVTHGALSKAVEYIDRLLKTLDEGWTSKDVLALAHCRAVALDPIKAAQGSLGFVFTVSASRGKGRVKSKPSVPFQENRALSGKLTRPERMR